MTGGAGALERSYVREGSAGIANDYSSHLRKGLPWA